MIVYGAGYTRTNGYWNITGQPQLSSKIILHVLNDLGYRTQINGASADGQALDLEIEMTGVKKFDPKLIAENLREHRCVLTGAKPDTKGWKLNLDASKAVWNIQMIGSDEGVELQRTSTPYWFRVEAGQNVKIQAPYGNIWYPDVAVFDPSMHLLYSFRSDKGSDEFQFPLPEGSYYLKISHASGIKALKEGMWVELASPER